MKATKAQHARQSYLQRVLTDGAVVVQESVVVALRLISLGSLRSFGESLLLPPEEKVVVF